MALLLPLEDSRVSPDDLFAQVDRLARLSRRSRSDAYSAALSVSNLALVQAGVDVVLGRG